MNLTIERRSQASHCPFDNLTRDPAARCTWLQSESACQPEGPLTPAGSYPTDSDDAGHGPPVTVALAACQ
jgi:hypothetical protein